MEKIQQTATKKHPKVVAVDLFCGAGGLTHGLEKSGISVALGVDIDPACEYPFSANNNAKFLLKSVDDVKPSELLAEFEGAEVKLLAGCAPCQTFSSYNQKADSSDKRWWLLRQFSRLIRETSPDIVTMENVPGLVEQDVFHEFVADLETKGYKVKYEIVDCTLYGLPQQRTRLVLLASKFGEIGLIGAKEFGKPRRTVKDVIESLPEIVSGEVCVKDELHQCSALNEKNLKRIRLSKPGGTWRDWPEDLVAECHKKHTGRTYPSVYGRMSWNDPAPTITTQFFGFGNGRFGHPEQDRAISLREGAIFQGFPKKYKFLPKGAQVSKKVIGRLIGNAVPVTLGIVIGKSILKHLQEFDCGKE